MKDKSIHFVNLFPVVRVKRGEKPCSRCKEKINDGEEYTSVIYIDGIIRKAYGAFHNQCWTEFRLQKK